MYVNKRGIPWHFIPEADMGLPLFTGQQKVYTWWPVAIMNLKPEAADFQDLVDWKYVICVYQALLDKPVAWGMRISQLLNLPRLQDRQHIFSFFLVVLFSAPSTQVSIPTIFGHLLVIGKR